MATYSERALATHPTSHPDHDIKDYLRVFFPHLKDVVLKKHESN